MLNALYEARGYLLAVRTDVGAARELAARIGHAIEEAEAPAPLQAWQYEGTAPTTMAEADDERRAAG
jgi:hypothetical protein